MSKLTHYPAPELCLVQRDVEELIAASGAGDEGDVALSEAEAFREESRDGGVGRVVSGRSGDSDAQAARIAEAVDAVGGGAGSDADGEAHIANCQLGEAANALRRQRYPGHRRSQ